MNHEQALCKTDLIEIYRFTHSCEEPHRDPKEESCAKFSINFTEEDRFGLCIGKEEWLMTSKEVFFTKPDLIFRCQHFEEIPKDVCFSVCYNEDYVEEIRTIADISLKNYQPSIKLTNRTNFLYWKLSQEVLLENLFEIELLAASLFIATTKQENFSCKIFSEKQKRKYFEKIEAITNILKTNYHENHSLISISNKVGMSPYYFARTFSQLLGVAPHQYLLRIRLEKAKELLLENLSVTETCFAVGFTNLSHFIRTFIRHYGVSPSNFSNNKNDSETFS